MSRLRWVGVWGSIRNPSWWMATWWWYQQSGDEVVGVVVAAVGSLLDVVGLEAVLAVAAFDRAVSLVSPGDETPDCWGDRFSHIRIGDGVESVGDDYPDLAGAEDLGEGVGTDPRSGRDGGAGLSERFGG